MKGPISHRSRQRCVLQTKRLQPLPRLLGHTEDDAVIAAPARQHQYYSDCRVVSRGLEVLLLVASAANVGRDKFLFPASADGVKSHVANVCPVGPLSSRGHCHCGLFLSPFLSVTVTVAIVIVTVWSWFSVFLLTQC